MPTTDNQQHPIPQNQAGTTFQPVNDFDFGNLGTPETTEMPTANQPSSDFSLNLPTDAAQNVPEASPTPQSPDVSQGFDFSLDLPNAYETPVPEQASQTAPIVESSPSQFQAGEESSPVQVEENLTSSAMHFAPADQELAPAPMESLLHEESQPSPSFLSPEENSLILNGEETPVPEQENPVMKTPFAAEEPLPNTMDPFEAMKASLESPSNFEASSFSAPVEEVKEKVEEPVVETTDFQNEDQNQQNQETVVQTMFQEPAPQVQSEVGEKSDSQAQEAQTVSLESMLQSPVENTEVLPSNSPLLNDPLDAPSLQIPSPAPMQEDSVSVAQSVSSEVAPMLSLDEMIAQPHAVEVASPVQNNAVAQLSESQIPQMVNPLTAPIGYPPIQQAPQQKAPSKAGIFAGVLFGVVLLAAGVMMFIKYPDLLQGGNLFAEPSSHEPQIAQNTGDNLAPEIQEEHSSAGAEEELASEATGAEESQLLSGDLPVVEVNTGENLSEEIQEITLGEDVDDMNSESEDTIVEKPDLNEEKNQISENSPALPGEDALDAVEDLVGPINVNDALLQEISSYRAQVSELAQTAKAQGNKVALKLRARVVMQLERLEQDLENGGKMSISDWKAKKAELDQILENANNA